MPAAIILHGVDEVENRTVGLRRSRPLKNRAENRGASIVCEAYREQEKQRNINKGAIPPNLSRY